MGPVVVLTTEIAGGLIFAGALVNDSERTAVLGLVGLVVIACAKWLWGAIVRQIKAAIVEVDNDRYTTLTQSITALSQSNETQHDGIEHRVAVVERNIAIHATRLDDGSKRMAEIIDKLGVLSTDVGQLRTTQLANGPTLKEHP